MAVFKGLSGIFATGPTSWVLQRSEPRGGGVLKLGDVVWRAPDTSEENRTAGKTASKNTSETPRETISETISKIGANGYLPDIIILEDVVLNPRETHEPVEWQPQMTKKTVWEPTANSQPHRKIIPAQCGMTR